MKVLCSSVKDKTPTMTVVVPPRQVTFPQVQTIQLWKLIEMWPIVVGCGQFWFHLVWFWLLCSNLVYFGLVMFGLVWFILVWSGFFGLVWFILFWSGLDYLVWLGSLWSGLFWSGFVCSGLVWFCLLWSDLLWSVLFALVWVLLTWFCLLWSGLVTFGLHEEWNGRELMLLVRFWTFSGADVINLVLLWVYFFCLTFWVRRMGYSK